MTKLNIPSPELTTCLEVSTGHITQRDSKLLAKANDANPLIVHEYAEGFFVYSIDFDHQDSAKALLAYGYSQELVNLLEFAHDRGYKWLVLDADGPTYDGVPEFDW